MSKSLTPKEQTTASNAINVTAPTSCEEHCTTPKLRLEYLGRDSWERPVYVCDGRLYVDVDPRRSRPTAIYTKHGNTYEGEPCDPIPEGTIIEFVPERDTWSF